MTCRNSHQLAKNLVPVCIAAIVLVTSTAIPAFAQSGTWTGTGSLSTPRAVHTATLLPNGQVLVAGGQDASGLALASAELYNPTTGTWTVTGSMATARRSHTATLLANGEVLVVGGIGNSNPQAPCLASAELYNPSTGQWTPTGNMTVTRFSHGMTLLQNRPCIGCGGRHLLGLLGRIVTGNKRGNLRSIQWYLDDDR
jgi:N-acetylneuraminic acid mutarotase